VSLGVKKASFRALLLEGKIEVKLFGGGEKEINERGYPVLAKIQTRNIGEGSQEVNSLRGVGGKNRGRRKCKRMMTSTTSAIRVRWCKMAAGVAAVGKTSKSGS